MISKWKFDNTAYNYYIKWNLISNQYHEIYNMQKIWSTCCSTCFLAIELHVAAIDSYEEKGEGQTIFNLPPDVAHPQPQPQM